MLVNSFTSNCKLPLKRREKLETLKNLEERSHKHLKVLSIYKAVTRVQSAGTNDLEVILAVLN